MYAHACIYHITKIPHHKNTTSPQHTCMCHTTCTNHITHVHHTTSNIHTQHTHTIPHYINKHVDTEYKYTHLQMPYNKPHIHRYILYHIPKLSWQVKILRKSRLFILSHQTNSYKKSSNE